ncbi:alpha/beta hydrolase [Curvibacter sp. APW13]|uniref:alpha/beta hydrolase n=1 Tax=Curvibacter sp. APW13 TaxID=3077236 RepID=UPI0028E05AE5|nr:alpha/beta hydrolase [Curvibacter sp. APW13]MDT8989923.1 alpha/beta hydrolase [Curvibacter sp. APW13]
MPTLYREFDTQAALDAQYNPSAGLPPGVNPALPYVEAAQQARSTLRHTLDVPFGPTLHETLDIFPADTPNAPVFVFIHGGYWRAFSSKEFSGVALGLQPLGITTVVVNYALCPWVSIDEITRQCRAAVAWTLRNIQHHGGDPTRVAVGGHSAGGHLSAMCLLTDWARDYGLPRDPLKAGLLFSGLFDIAPLRYTYLQPMIQLDDGVVRRQSPLHHVRHSGTPIWTTWGAKESTEFARQSTAFHDAWTAAGNRGELSATADADHFEVIHPLFDPQSAHCQWLQRQLAA